MSQLTTKTITVRAQVKGFVLLPIRTRLGVRRYRELKNTLMANFFRMLYGILAYENVDLVYLAGGTATWRVQGDEAYGPPEVYICSESQFIGFTANACSSVCKIYPTSSDIYYEGFIDRVCATVAYVASCNGSSSEINMSLYDTGGGTHRYAVSHVVASIAQSDPVKHRVCFYEPWLANMAKILAALMCDCDSFSAVDMQSLTVALRGSGQLFAGPAKILIGTGTNPFSFSDATMTNPIELDTTVTLAITSTDAKITLNAFIQPSSNMTIYEVGVKLPVYDTSGVVHDVLIIRHVNTQGYALEANKLYAIQVYIYGP